MSAIFFTADHHFGHPGIIGMCQRPFTDVDEMDEAFVEEWNAVVRRGDTVWHLGDFAHKANAERCQSIFGRLNGRKNLVLGSHDKEKVRNLG